MLDPIEISKKSPLLRRAFVRQQWATLVTTALAAFVVAALLWPLNVRGYRSEAQIDLTGVDAGQRQLLLDRQLPVVLQGLLQPASLIKTLANIQQEVPLHSRHLRGGDVQRVRDHLSVGLLAATQGEPSHLRVVFLGDGFADEQRLVELIADQIRVGLVGLHQMGSTFVAADPSLPVEMTPFQKLDRAEWLVDQIEEGITAAKDQTVQLIANAKPVDTPASFRNIGHVRVVSGNEVDSIHQTLDSVDVTSLKGMIGQIKSSPQAAAATFKASPVTQTPVGAIPPHATVVLLGMVSLLFGSVVALNISPFTELGFQDADAVAETLGVPVIAQFPAVAEPTDAAENAVAHPNVLQQGSRPTWANRVATFASTILFALAVLVVGFLFVYPSVQEAFGQSVWHGLARIVWTFTG